MVISALIELLILVLLAGVFCWNRGLSARVSGFLGVFDRPPVKELDVTGVNSSNVVLMDVKSGAVIGDLNGKEQIYRVCQVFCVSFKKIFWGGSPPHSYIAKLLKINSLKHSL